MIERIVELGLVTDSGAEPEYKGYTRKTARFVDGVLFETVGFGEIEEGHPKITFTSIRVFFEDRAIDVPLSIPMTLTWPVAPQITDMRGLEEQIADNEENPI